jgi:hypothetical protein
VKPQTTETDREAPPRGATTGCNRRRIGWADARTRLCDRNRRARSGLASGEARVESDGDVVVYRGVTDIMAALKYFRDKAAAASRHADPRSSVAIFSRD